MDRGQSNTAVLGDPAAEPALEFERITPELALVCPELAEVARLRLPDRDPELPWLFGSRSEAIAEPIVLIPKRSPWLRVPIRSRMMVAACAAAFGLLATGALTAAEVGQGSDPEPAPPVESTLPSLVVPDVIGKPYVFAKQLLDDAGFAWEVEGSIEGYAANVVGDQFPSPGTEIVGIDLPRIALTLDRNPDYEERGVPQNVSRDLGTPVPNRDPALEPTSSAAGESRASEKANAAESGAPKVESGEEAETDEEAVDPSAETGEGQAEIPTEPEPSSSGDESALERSLFLASWILDHPRPTDEAVSYWLWQHSVIIDSARAGDPDAAEALQILIEIDRDLQESWGVGAKSEALAREALQAIQSQ